MSGFYNVFKDKISLAQNVDIPNYNTYYNIGRYKTWAGHWKPRWHGADYA